MHEGGLREFLGYLQHGVHIAKTGAEDDVIIFASHVLDDPLGVRPFRYCLDITGFYPLHLGQSLAADIM